MDWVKKNIWGCISWRKTSRVFFLKRVSQYLSILLYLIRFNVLFITLFITYILTFIYLSVELLDHLEMLIFEKITGNYFTKKGSIHIYLRTRITNVYGKAGVYVHSFGRKRFGKMIGCWRYEYDNGWIYIGSYIKGKAEGVWINYNKYNPEDIDKEYYLNGNHISKEKWLLHSNLELIIK